MFSFGFIKTSNEIVQTENPSNLELRITAKSNILNLSSKDILPEINISIFNHSNDPVKIVMPGDGSLSGWRTPIVRWSIVKVGDEIKRHQKDGLPEVPNNRMECKSINRIQIEEIKTLVSNAELQIDNLLNYFYIPKELGTYRVKLFYKNQPNHKWVRSGYHGEKVKEIISNETKEFLLISNELIFKIID